MSITCISTCSYKRRNLTTGISGYIPTGAVTFIYILQYNLSSWVCVGINYVFINHTITHLRFIAVGHQVARTPTIRTDPWKSASRVITSYCTHHLTHFLIRAEYNGSWKEKVQRKVQKIVNKIFSFTFSW